MKKEKTIKNDENQVSDEQREFNEKMKVFLKTDEGRRAILDAIKVSVKNRELSFGDRNYSEFRRKTQ